MRVCETFRSLQGEGVLIGAPTVFVRTVGCNLDCVWCDTAYARTGGHEVDIGSLIDEVGAYDTRCVCLTGGEPLLQVDTPELVSGLVANGHHVTVETNGSMDVSVLPPSDMMMVSMDLKCPSSGMSDRMRMSNLTLLTARDQLKFVIGSDDDRDYASSILSTNEVDATVVLTPVGGTDLRSLAEWALDLHMDVRVLPQLHKLIWGDARGV